MINMFLGNTVVNEVNRKGVDPKKKKKDKSINNLSL